MTPFNLKFFKTTIFILLMIFASQVEMKAQKDKKSDLQTIFQICNLADGILSETSTCDVTDTTIPINTDFNCLGKAYMSFHLVDVFEEIPDAPIMLPEQYPSFYFRWKEDSETEVTIGPYRELRFVQTLNGIDYYAIDFELTVNTEDACVSNPTNIYLPIEVLHYPIGDGSGDEELVEYPVENYTDEGEIFSCMIFQETNGCCSDNGCPELDYLLDLCVDCKSCNIQKFIGGNSNESFYLKEEVYPNPFTEEINLSIEVSDPQIIQIQFTNINSQESIVIEESVDVGKNLKKIDTSMLKSGVYIVTINDGNKTWSKKIIKLGIGESKY